MIKDLLEKLLSVKSSPTLLNQYRDDGFDEPAGSHLLRLENLQDYLNLFVAKAPSIMIIGESAGHNGAKINGLHLFGESFYRQILPELSPVARSVPESMTSKILDRTFLPESAPLAFNIVPFFTHPAEEWTSNRTPSKIEIKQYSIFAQALYEIFKPAEVLAMGRLAEMGLRYRGIKNTYLRHPSMGGKPAFIKAIDNILRG